MKFKRYLAALMAITILFSLSIAVSAATVADATIDTTRTGSGGRRKNSFRTCSKGSRA